MSLQAVDGPLKGSPEASRGTRVESGGWCDTGLVGIEMSEVVGNLVAVYFATGL